MSLEERFLVALAVTAVLETAVLAVATRFGPAAGRASFARLAAAGALPSALTLPYLWFILPKFVNGPWYVPLAESLAVLVEAPILALLLPATAWRALGLSLLCNLVSWWLGPPLVTGLLRWLATAAPAG